MAESYDAQIDYYISYWRRKVAAGSMTLTSLRTLADTLYSVDDTEVIITETGFERGVLNKGVVNIPKWAIGAALEALIRELDPDAPAVPASAQGTSRGNSMVLV
ncbi:MAG: hypothetical protein JSR82_24485 [Verrucomicrobia bacterium]|nr:hypothetical protein [Verrucomicrobiota bacterium]